MSAFWNGFEKNASNRMGRHFGKRIIGNAKFHPASQQSLIPQSKKLKNAISELKAYEDSKDYMGDMLAESGHAKDIDETGHWFDAAKNRWRK